MLNRLANRLLHVAAGSLALRGFVLVAGFACQLLLTRLLSLPEYGIYVFAIAWVRTLGIPATLGFERLIIREVAALRSARNWGEWRGLLRWSRRTLLASSITIAIASAMVAWLAHANWSSTVLLAALLIPMLTMTRLQQFVVQGMGHPILSQLAEALVLPTTFAVGLIGYYLLTGHLSVRRAMLINLGATATALAVATVLLARYLPPAVRSATATDRWRDWSRSITPLLLTTGAASITAQIPTLMLGLLTNRARFVGPFAIARSLADLALIPVLALTPIWAPHVATLWSRGRRAEVQATVTLWARRITLAYLPILLILMAFAEPLLRLFGPQFVPAATALRILCVGYLVDAAAGSNGVVLVMAGRERDVAWVSSSAALLCAILCVVLIPADHLIGAALAATLTMIASNIAIGWLGWRRLGILPTVFAPLRRSPGHSAAID